MDYTPYYASRTELVPFCTLQAVDLMGGKALSDRGDLIYAYIKPAARIDFL